MTATAIQRTERLRGDAAHRLRSRLFARDGHRCVYCGSNEGPFEWEHVVPLAMGGSNALDNALTLCFECHSSTTPVTNRRTRQIKIECGIIAPRRTHAARMWTLDRFPWLRTIVTRRVKRERDARLPATIVLKREEGDAYAAHMARHRRLCREHGIRMERSGAPVPEDMDRFCVIQIEATKPQVGRK